MNFRLEIKLGNAGMSTYDDIAWALNRLTEKFRNDCTDLTDENFEGETGGVIKDINGNTVGEWSI